MMQVLFVANIYLLIVYYYYHTNVQKVHGISHFSVKPADDVKFIPGNFIGSLLLWSDNDWVWLTLSVSVMIRKWNLAEFNAFVFEPFCSYL